jgi:hypothetical protein
MIKENGNGRFRFKCFRSAKWNGRQAELKEFSKEKRFSPSQSALFLTVSALFFVYVPQIEGIII